jgi:hypothetical protein
MNAAENYLRDVVLLLIERGKEAKSQRDTLASSADKEQAAFENGRATAYYEVVSTMLGQLASFGLTRTALGLPEGFDPDRELL